LEPLITEATIKEEKPDFLSRFPAFADVLVWPLLHLNAAARHPAVAE
jgi:hypothetical protein